MTATDPTPDKPLEDQTKTPSDYDEYGYEPQQDDPSAKPDEALTDPA
jgi:hypothetical protein